MPNSSINHITDFNAFHRMANGALQARHDDVQVFEFSEVGKDSVKETPLFKTNFYQIGLFTDGEFEVSHFGTTQVVNRNNAVVMFKPGQTCSFSKADPNAKGYAIMFKEHFIDWRLNNANTIKDFSMLNPSFECVLFLEDENFMDLMDVASKMNYEYRNPLNEYSLNIIRLYCQILIEKLNRICAQQVQPLSNSVQYKTLLEFKTLVYENIHKTKKVADYAEMLCMTEKTLINHIRQTTESTPKEFISALIVEESKAMFSNEATVDQVASYFNFTDQAHFSNFFKNRTGQNPSDFKKR
jgi:AraC-like DNA-binding protein